MIAVEYSPKPDSNSEGNDVRGLRGVLINLQNVTVTGHRKLAIPYLGVLATRVLRVRICHRFVLAARHYELVSSS